jgi:hypothetical protein
VTAAGRGKIIWMLLSADGKLFCFLPPPRSELAFFCATTAEFMNAGQTGRSAAFSSLLDAELDDCEQDGRYTSRQILGIVIPLLFYEKLTKHYRH